MGDKVTLQPSAAAGPDPLVLPAEALLRLVYGRLDLEHTPSGVDDPSSPGSVRCSPASEHARRPSPG